MRGEFIRGDGLVIPNNITLQGKKLLLESFFWVDRLPQNAFQMGLCDAVFSQEMDFSQLNEPTAAGGYTIRDIDRVQGNWATGILNGEAYAESVPVTWSVNGTGFSRDITRLFLALRGTFVIALSGALPQPLRITTATPTAERTFRYRMYMG